MVKSHYSMETRQEYHLWAHMHEETRRQMAFIQVKETKQTLDEAEAQVTNVVDALAQAKADAMEAARLVGQYRLKGAQVPESVATTLADAERREKELRQQRDDALRMLKEARSKHDGALMYVRLFEQHMREAEDTLLGIYEADTRWRPGRSGFPCLHCAKYPDQHVGGEQRLCPRSRARA